MEHEVREIKEAVERMVENHSGNQNVTNVRLEGGKSLVHSLMFGIVCGFCLGLGLGVVGWVMWALNRQDSFNMWASQEVTSIRSYITNGKLQPMNPRPFGPEEKKEKP